MAKRHRKAHTSKRRNSADAIGTPNSGREQYIVPRIYGDGIMSFRFLRRVPKASMNFLSAAPPTPYQSGFSITREKVLKPKGPPRQVEGSLIGWKRAGLSTKGFQPINSEFKAYEATAKATCQAYSYTSIPMWVHPELEAPNWNCSCGFYAANERSYLKELANSHYSGVVDLEVELYGRVIIYEHGYRAEYQKVVSARVDVNCRSVGFQHCTGHAEWLIVINDSGTLIPVCTMCAAAIRQMDFSIAAQKGNLNYPAVYSITEVAELVGVHDLRWKEWKDESG